mgnify:CR=1 FL=1|tara:strand:- start:71 stop:388 length:318 start_codon:yes stop_codon:yes gene_type:complete
MIRTVNKYDFIDAFRKMGRTDNFSFKGLVALYEELEMVENDIGKPIELDVIALCCEFTEYDNLEEFEADYGREFSDIDKRFKYSIEDSTTMIPIEGTDGFIIQNF